MPDPVLPASFHGRRVWVAGHRGMVGSALTRALAAEGAVLLEVDRSSLDLTRQADTERWVSEQRPEFVFIAAGKVGGIWANDHFPGQFLYDNLQIQTNVIEAARRSGVRKTMVFASSCIYPRLAPQPIVEESLLTGPLEPTNEWYAIAKIAAVKLAEAYRREYGMDVISVMPTNLYGPGDDYDPLGSHVAAALLRRVHEAKEAGADAVTLWGTGTPQREFLHVDDLAGAALHLMKCWSGTEPINIGSAEELTIAELAALVAQVVGWPGRFALDQSKPDGTPRKRLDTSRLTALGWTPSIRLADGLASAYADFRARAAAGEFVAAGV